MKVNVKGAFRSFSYRLWLAILATMLLPAVYQTARIYFLGDMPAADGINIASQLSWVNLFYEVVQEALILPLFCLLGKALSDREEFTNRVRTGLLVTAGIYTLVSIAVIAAARPLVIFMAQDGALVDATVTYVRLETVAAIFSTLWRFMSLVLVTLKRDKLIYILLAVQTALSVLLDTLLISGLPFSAQVGVNGIAVSNMIVNAAIVLLSACMLCREGVKLFSRKKLSFGWMKEWFSVGRFSGLESLLRNLAFMVMVVRMVNVVSEQGNYWIANNFIWQWLLLPSLALADVVKKETGEDPANVCRKTFGYLCMTAVFAVFWLASIPLWKPFLRFVLNVAEYETVFRIVLVQTGFYLTYLFNSSIFDSTFYGLGKTNYMLIQSVCIDAVYYGFMFVLYVTGIFVPTLLGISLMFGTGMALDFIPTMILYRRLLKKNGLKIDFKLNGEAVSA